MTAPLLAVDAPSMLYRAFFALPKTIKAPDGHPVNALLGSVNLVLAEVERRRPRVTVMCFGPDAATYRAEAYPAYHAARDPMPAELGHQWERAPELYEALGWRVADHDSLEADDLLGTLARREEKAGGEALILTGDRDLFQCASERTTVLYVSTGVRGAEPVGPAEVVDRYGVPPELVPDFIALRGDPSDGLPGAKGVGAKGAAELLRRHGSLEAVLDAAPLERRPKLRESLLADAELIRSFKDIATLRDAKVPRPRDRKLNRRAGAAKARELGMNRLAERLESGG